MGVETNVYVGAYLKIDKIPKIEKEVSYKQCESCEYTVDRNSNSEKFCKYCGGKIITGSAKAKERISIDDIMEDDENLFEIESEDNILIPNRKTKSGVNVFCGEDKIENLPDPNCIEIFEKDFKKQISKFEKAGVTYKIKSGIITYYS